MVCDTLRKKYLNIYIFARDINVPIVIHRFTFRVESRREIYFELAKR